MTARVRVVSLRSFDPLIASLSPKAYRAWGRSLEWSCFHGRDGMLTPEDLRVIGAGPAATQELLERGVWKLDEQGRTFVAELREGPVVAEVEGREVGEHRSKAALKQKRYRDRKRQGNTDGNAEGNALPVTLPVTSDPNVTVTAVTGDLQGVSGSGSSPDPGFSSVLASDSEDLSGSARDSEPRARRGKRPWPASGLSELERTQLTAYGATKGLRRSQTEEQLEALELWATSNGKLKSDWMATAKGWLRRYASGTAPGAPRVANGNGPPEDHRRPYHEPIKDRPEVPPEERLSAAEIAQLGKQVAGIGRRV